MVEPEIYHAKSGDNLFNIALRFNTSPSFLQEINGIYPPILYKDTEVTIRPVEDMASLNHSFYVQLSSNNIEYPGTITFLEDSFVFEQRQMTIGAPRIVCKIDLVSVISTSIFPHPSLSSADVNDPSQPAVIIICYFSMPLDTSSVDVIAFNGSRAELNALHTLTERSSQKMQKQVSFNAGRTALRVAELRTTDSLKDLSLPAPLRSRFIPKNIDYVVGKSEILESIEMFALRKILPRRLRTFTWMRIFALSEDGISYSSMYEKAKGAKQCLICLKTDEGTRMGAFLSQGLSNKPRFYGTGETFVFHFLPDLKVYKWSGANNNFISSTKSEIIMGSGGGAALWLDKYMKNGRSENCATFNSPPLSGKWSAFNITNLEVWDVSHISASV